MGVALISALPAHERGHVFSRIVESKIKRLSSFGFVPQQTQDASGKRVKHTSGTQEQQTPSDFPQPETPGPSTSEQADAPQDSANYSEPVIHSESLSLPLRVFTRHI